MGPQLRWYEYTAYSKHYTFTTLVYSKSIKAARVSGKREAMKVFGGHAPIHQDLVKEK